MVAAEGLGIQTVKVPLAENLCIFFILTGDQQGGNSTGFQPFHIFNGNDGGPIVIASFTSRFTGDFIHPFTPFSGHIIVQFSNGKPGIQGQVQGGRGNGQLQNGGACRLGGKAPFTGSLDQVRAACRVCKGFIQHRVKLNIQVLQFHSGGGIAKPNQRTFTGVQIAVDGQGLLKHSLQQKIIGDFFIHQISTSISVKMGPKMLTTVKVVSTFFLFTSN